jgi:hypothetical protein
MERQGICHKMHAALLENNVADPSLHQANVEYKFNLDRTVVDLPFQLGQQIEIEWTGKIYCVSCGNSTPKSYSQGHCFKCFKTKASCRLYILRMLI